MESEGAWGTEAKACKRLGAMGWMSQAFGSVVGWELQVLGSVVLGAGICACEGELRALSDLPARKNDVRLRFNSASGSSLKFCKPSTCGFVNALCPDTEPVRFKTQTCGFFLGHVGLQEREGGLRTCCWPPSCGDWRHL